MVQVITINRPDVVALVEQAAARLTGGNKTEAVKVAMVELLRSRDREGTLFGASRGSVRTMMGVDLTGPALDIEPEASTGAELDH